MAEREITHSKPMIKTQICQIMLYRGAVLHTQEYGDKAVLLVLESLFRGNGECRDSAVAVDGIVAFGYEPYRMDRSLRVRKFRRGIYREEHSVHPSFPGPHEVHVPPRLPLPEVYLLEQHRRSVAVRIQHEILV